MPQPPPATSLAPQLTQTSSYFVAFVVFTGYVVIFFGSPCHGSFYTAVLGCRNHKYPMKNYQPYAYLIGWPALDRWYYGIEYGQKTKIANPLNLWVNYFTSSDVVKEFRSQHGEPSVLEIRKTFETSKAAIDWEHKVLRRLKVKHSNRWLNLSDGAGIPIECSGGKVTKARGVGIFAWTAEQRSAQGKIIGKIGGPIGGKIVGQRHFENGTGLFGMSPEAMQSARINGAKRRAELHSSRGGKIGGKIIGRWPWIINRVTEKKSRVAPEKLNKFLQDNPEWARLKGYKK